VTYSNVGPFTNNNSPGISSTFLNNIESFLDQIDSPIVTDANISAVGGTITALGLIVNGPIAPNPASHSINGGTSGTAKLYQVMQGTYKHVLVYCSNFRTGGSNQSIAIPVPFTAGALIRSGNVNDAGDGISLLAGGITQALNIITALSVSAGTVSSSSYLKSYSFGECPTAFDTVQWTSGGTAGHTGFFELVGI
jgi:hypothetical protein